MICSSLMEGFTVVTMQSFVPELFCESIQNYKATVKQLYGVPPMFVWLAKSLVVSKYDLSSLNNACTGAAPIGVEVCGELKKRSECPNARWPPSCRTPN
ncbi:AMP-binding domain-containing protein [Aphelenchoides fujianensis]|nr:AMP-binding domain-containing protein [Aphelenchoides fujianensis]